MNLLFLSNLYPPLALGGYEQLCQEAAEGLAQRGHRVTILTTNYKQTARQPVQSQVNGVAVVRSLFLEAPTDYYRPADFFLRRSSEEKANQSELKRLIDQIKPDLIMVWGMWNLSRNLPKLAESLLPERTVYYLCSYWPSDDDPHTAYWQLPTNRKLSRFIKWPLKSLALRQLQTENYPPELAMKHSACVSGYVRDTLVRNGKLPANAVVISNGIDPQPYLQPLFSTENRPSATPLRLLYFGRLIADKGVHTALEALAQLKKQGQAQQVHLTILGGGHPDYEAQLHQLVAQEQLGEQVEFVSSVAREEIPTWLGKHDIFLFTSIWAEPMARSVMEAMAAGMLVIGSTVGGQKEMLVDGENALTFAAGDAQQLAQQIARALAAPAQMAKIAAQGRKLVLEQFTLERMITAMENYLQGILSMT